MKYAVTVNQNGQLLKDVIEGVPYPAIIALLDGIVEIEPLDQEAAKAADLNWDNEGNGI